MNAEKVHLTGTKFEDKIYYRHTGYPGGIKAASARNILESRQPHQLITLSVKRMLGRGPLAIERLRNLYVYAGPEHPHAGQQPRFLDVAALNSKNHRDRTMSDSRSFEPKIEAIVEKVVERHTAPLRESDDKIIASQRELSGNVHEIQRQFRATQESTDRALEGLSNNQSETNKRLDKVESTLETIQRNTADTNDILKKILTQLASGSPNP